MTWNEIISVKLRYVRESADRQHENVKKSMCRMLEANMETISIC